jgi:diguanylate cyclase (GGDEF)-like protein
VLPVAVALISRELRRTLRPVQPIAEQPAQDESTGAYRSSSLNGILQEEVERGRRSKRSFTVCLVGLDDWHKAVADLGQAEAERRMKHAIAEVGASKRLLDKVVDVGDGEVFLVLAETPLGGAETVAWRLRARFSQELAAPVSVGIAEFPRDAVTETGLMEEVRQALSFARMAKIPVVDRSLLSSEQILSQA